jgi:hypothetical protein
VPENVRFPVYVLAKDCREFREYRALQDMRAYMEAIDVEGNEYDAWDVEGFTLKLATRNSKRAWLHLERTETRISDARGKEIRLQAVPYVNGRRLSAKG